MFKKLILIMIACAGLSHCATDGKYFKSETAWIKEGVTSQQDAISILGQPHAIGSSSGTVTWTYGYYRYRLIGKSYTKELKLYWDDQKKIKQYSFNSSFPEDKAAALPKSAGAPLPE